MRPLWASQTLTTFLRFRLPAKRGVWPAEQDLPPLLKRYYMLLSHFVYLLLEKGDAMLFC